MVADGLAAVHISHRAAVRRDAARVITGQRCHAAPKPRSNCVRRPTGLAALIGQHRAVGSVPKGLKCDLLTFGGKPNDLGQLRRCIAPVFNSVRETFLDGQRSGVVREGSAEWMAHAFIGGAHHADPGKPRTHGRVTRRVANVRRRPQHLAVRSELRLTNPCRRWCGCRTGRCLVRCGANPVRWVPLWPLYSCTARIARSPILMFPGICSHLSWNRTDIQSGNTLCHIATRSS
jgi:hypothetical protein